MTGDGWVLGVQIQCTHCGTYTVTVEQARDLKGRTFSDGVICYRCDEEARCLVHGRIASRPDDWRDVIQKAGV